MAGSLVSAGVSVNIQNDSFFIPAASPTVPLIFIATQSGKKQPNGITPAAGTLESSVVRTVTSLAQSIQLYGIPTFKNDTSGNEYHGDARNETGLLALNNFLAAGNRAYVVRANIDLTDEAQTYLSLGTPVLTGNAAFNGIGDGTIVNVTAPDNRVKPQLITVTLTSSSTFSVTGSVTGYIGAGSVDLAFSSTTVNFTLQSGATPFTAGDRFSFNLAYTATAEGGNTGNGKVINLVTDDLAVPETFSITFASPTTYSVSGTVSGPAGSGVVNTPFDNNRLNFSVVPGGTPFAAGDVLTVVVSSVTISAPLGANDAAKRVAIVTALQAEINSNVEVRSELYEFNLIACPGYPEVVDELIALSVDVKDEALVLADTPADKSPEQVAQWAMTSERFNSTSVAYYYPWGLQSNLDGRNVLGSPSGIALRTIAVSDNNGYVWDAPAGTDGGVVTGVSKVGYYTGTPGTATVFVESNVNQGQRDNLYEYYKNINPIAYFPGRGLLVWGQKTSAPSADALDRINVARLVMYLKRSLRKGALPFVFQPNDKITRDNLKAAADGILHDILVKRGLYDFASLCNEGNNTADVIDRNEMYLDVGIKPTKIAEFVYVTIRIPTTGGDF